MRGASRFYKVLVWVTVACLLVGCGAASRDLGETTNRSGGKQGSTLTVFAAASLTDAFDEIAKDFERQNPGTNIRTSFGGSSTLAAQIQQGAPADAFASADEAQMKNIRQDGLLVGEPETFVRNREVVVVPKSNPAGIQGLGDLSGSGVRLVLAAEEVPAAEYAEDILRKAADDRKYGPEFRQGVLDNIVSREEDVRAAVNRVVLGDADATFGYASDVTPGIRDEVKVIDIPEDLNIIATYPIAVLGTTEDKELAQKWVEFVLSEDGQRVLEEWGFEPVGPVNQ